MTTEKKIDSVELILAVNKKVENVRTRSLDLSFNEILDMKEAQELIIAPDYQRLFCWSDGKQSRFIESILLEMPLPPIFMIEKEQNVFELIDGLQRITSYMNFRGKHTTNEDGSPKYLTLEDCDIVKELNGLTYEELPSALKIKLKRNFIRAEIIRKESDKRLRYYMFKRLNTGGEELSEQEIRNCTIRLLDARINEFIIELSKTSSFVKCITHLSDEQQKRMYAEELVLRFFAFKNDRQRYTHDIADFMTQYMEDVATNALTFDYAKERTIFERTFEILEKTLGEYSFSGTNESGNYIGKFLVYHYETFALGLQNTLDKIDLSNGELLGKIRQALEQIKKDSTFKAMTTGGGKNTAKKLNDRIKFVEAAMEKVVR